MKWSKSLFVFGFADHKYKLRAYFRNHHSHKNKCKYCTITRRVDRCILLTAYVTFAHIQAALRIAISKIEKVLNGS